MEAVKLYNQEATQFTLRFFIAPDTTLRGQMVLERRDELVQSVAVFGRL